MKLKTDPLQLESLQGLESELFELFHSLIKTFLSRASAVARSPSPEPAKRTRGARGRPKAK